MAHAHCMLDNLGYNTQSEYVMISILYFNSRYNKAPKYIMIHLHCLSCLWPENVSDAHCSLSNIADK
jgi:hypothetical protein